MSDEIAIQLSESEARAALKLLSYAEVELPTDDPLYTPATSASETIYQALVDTGADVSTEGSASADELSDLEPDFWEE